GNSASRRALVEAAWHFKSCSPKPKAPPAGSAVPAAVKRRCDANVAVARELACRVWEVGRRAEGTLA
ncbi:IS110 family transposase, partial [Collinsella tanakaei]